MKVSIVSFSKHGYHLSEKLATKLTQYDIQSYAMEKFCEVDSVVKPLQMNLSQWTKEQFEHKDGLLFIGASGIAVRSIAPYVKDKTKDPAVIVIDDMGKYVIPILSGHLGGANELAMEIAAILGAIPVITTATDIHHLFAVDVFAKKNNLTISNMTIAKEISAELLTGNSIGLTCEGEIAGNIPRYIEKDNTILNLGMYISYQTKEMPYHHTLQLVPKCLTLGIGCRRGKTLEEIETKVIKVLQENQLSISAIAKVASIDLKKTEKGLLEFCHKYNLQTIFFDEKELGEVEGSFSDSRFVKEITGVDNVCERAAVKGSEQGELIVKKYAEDGITIAVAKKEWCINFE